MPYIPYRIGVYIRFFNQTQYSDEVYLSKHTRGFSFITGALNVLGSITRAKSLLLIGILLLLSLVLVDTIYMLLRAARHYSSDKQGHLRSFVATNIVVG